MGEGLGTRDYGLRCTPQLAHRGGARLYLVQTPDPRIERLLKAPALPVEAHVLHNELFDSVPRARPVGRTFLSARGEATLCRAKIFTFLSPGS